MQEYKKYTKYTAADKTSSAPLYKIKVSTGVPTKYLSYKDGLKVFLSIPFIMFKTIL